MAAIAMIVTSLIMTVVTIFIGALLLMLSAKIFKLKDQSYMTALYITTILGIVGFLIGLLSLLGSSFILIAGVIGFIVGIILGIYLIKIKYDLDWGKAVLVWLVYFVLSLIVGFVIAFILGILFMAIGLGALGAAGGLGAL
ncbi:MAG: hypothetical protein V1740_00115 [Candidatus Woesearchaeota archaeon]